MGTQNELELFTQYIRYVKLLFVGNFLVVVCEVRQVNHFCRFIFSQSKMC